MAKRIFAFLSHTVFSIVLFAQGETNNWFFGINMGLTFNADPPINIAPVVIAPQHNSASISDTCGNILLYSDGTIELYNKDRAFVDVTFKSYGSEFNFQGIIFIPRPGNARQYYMFVTSDYTSLNAPPGFNGLSYTLIDVSLNGGQGGITATKNVALVNPATNIAAIAHQNNTDYWVLTHRYSNNDFYAYKVTNSGVSAPVITKTGSIIYDINGNGQYGDERIGHLKFSPNGKKVAYATSVFSGGIELYDFNDATGVLSNRKLIPTPGEIAHQLSFSPSGDLLYATSYDSVTGVGNLIAQYEVNAPDIQLSKRLIYDTISVSAYRYLSIQLGIDGKIYCASPANLGATIDYPNLAGNACFLNTSNNFYLVSDNLYELPNFIESYFTQDKIDYHLNIHQRTRKFLGSDTVACDFADYDLTVDSSIFVTARWQDGTYGFSYPVTSAGTYWVDLADKCSRTYSDTIRIYSRLTREVKDTIICSNIAYILPDGRTVSQSGVYTSTFKDISGCDSLIITTNLNVFGSSYKSENRVFCAGQSFVLSDGRVISASGTYFDTMQTILGCDSIIEYRLSFLSNITTTQDPAICVGGSFTLPGGRSVNVAGTYRDTLMASFGCDSIVITNLYVKPYLQRNQSVSICPGSSYVLPGGRVVSAAGTYRDTILTVNDCDSIVITDVALTAYLNSVRFDTVCAGQPFILPGGSIATITGVYSDTLSASNGCDSIVITNLHVKPNDFGVSLPETDTIIRGQSVQLLPGYENGTAISWQWSPNAFLSCADCEAPFANPDQAITFIITAYNDQGCSDTASIRIVVKVPGIYVPSAFSPNGDGLNDVFGIYAVGVQSLSFSIFNRWGERIFYTSQPNVAWDGTYNGNFVLNDDYFFLINAVMSDGSTISRSGSVSVLR